MMEMVAPGTELVVNFSHISQSLSDITNSLQVMSDSKWFVNVPFKAGYVFDSTVTFLSAVHRVNMVH